MAEEFLNLFLVGGLSATDAEAIRNELAKIRVVRKVRNATTELLEVYRCLGLIRAYTSKSVELDYPQATADPLIMRAYKPETIKSAGDNLGVDVGALVSLLSSTYRKLGFSADTLAPDVVRQYRDLSAPLLLKYQDISATKVYFMGPVFYGNAGRGWSFTFATGLPDPLEWNGSPWFASRFEVAPKDVQAVGDKNPFRALNFTAGICNHRWPTQRIYVWQFSKTSEQLNKAYALAHGVGRGADYIREAVAQLYQVFRTPNLKILSLQSFPDPLKAWTRLSARDVMISCRPKTPERRIAHAIWLKPGVRLGEPILKSLLAGLTGLVNIKMTGESELERALTAASLAVAVGLAVRQDPSTKEWSAIRKLQKGAERIHRSIWDQHRLPGTVKEGHRYGTREALAASLRTLSDLMGVPYGQLVDIHGGSAVAPIPKQAKEPNKTR